MENLWNQPQYKTIIEIWHTGTNLTACQTFTPLADGHGNGQRSYFFTFWNLQLSSILLFQPLMVQNYHHWPFRLRLVRTKGCLRPRPQDKTDKPPSSVKQKDYTIHNKHWLLDGKRIVCHACSAKNKGTSMKFKCAECNWVLCASTCFKIHYTKLHFWEPSYTKLEKWCTQTWVNDAIVLTKPHFQ